MLANYFANRVCGLVRALKTNVGEMLIEMILVLFHYTWEERDWVSMQFGGHLSHCHS